MHATSSTSFFVGRVLNVPYRIARAKTNPLGNGTVLLLCFGKLLLSTERFVGLGKGVSTHAKIRKVLVKNLQAS